ncbi:MAG: hypothetical protein GY847_32470 [Proteobacteria bacterium]|nr:hypothetical protein [Pseudomonadota bacterium]
MISKKEKWYQARLQLQITQEEEREQIVYSNSRKGALELFLMSLPLNSLGETELYIPPQSETGQSDYWN